MSFSEWQSNRKIVKHTKTGRSILLCACQIIPTQSTQNIPMFTTTLKYLKFTSHSYVKCQLCIVGRWTLVSWVEVRIPVMTLVPLSKALDHNCFIKVGKVVQSTLPARLLVDDTLACILIECPGPNFIELLSTQICLAWNFFLDKNRITKQSHVIFRISKQQLNISNKKYATNGIFVCNPVFIKEDIACEANLCAKQLYEIGSRWQHTP